MSANTHFKKLSAAHLNLVNYFRGMRTVSVEIGKYPFTFLVDTGGGTTMITPEACQILGLEPYGLDKGHRMSGELVEIRRYEQLEIGIGDWNAVIAPIGVFDLNRLLPRELPALDGILALDAFRGHVITLDWPMGEIRVHAGEQDPEENATAVSAVPYRVASGESGRFFTVLLPVQARRGLLWFLLDSGNIRGTLVAQFVVDEKLLDIDPDLNCELIIPNLPSIRLAVEKVDLIVDGALGTHFLSQGSVTLDLRNPVYRT